MLENHLRGVVKARNGSIHGLVLTPPLVQQYFIFDKKMFSCCCNHAWIPRAHAEGFRK